MDKEKKYSFLVLSPSEWGDSAVSNMQVSAELSKKYDVIYIETPGRRLPRINEFFRVIIKLKKFVFGSRKTQHKGLSPENVKIYSPLAIPIDNIFFTNSLPNEPVPPVISIPLFLNFIYFYKILFIWTEYA